MSQFQAGDIVTTESGAVIYLTGVDVTQMQNMSVSGMAAFNEGVIFSAADRGYDMAGIAWRAPVSAPLRLVANIRDVLRVMEEQGVSFEPAERELTEVERLAKENEDLKKRLFALENNSGIRTGGNASGPVA